MDRNKIITKTILFVFFACILLLSWPANAEDADIIFICNESVPFDSITKKEIKNIFLGDKLNWTPEKEITFVIMKKSNIHKKFARIYTKRSYSQFNNYWKRMLFTGKGRLPRSFGTEKALIDYIAKTDGAISYISSMTDTKNVKILTVSDK